MTKRRAMEGGGGGGGGSEFFICFTSRPSSSTSAACGGGGGGGGGGIRVPSTKSLMSPGRNSATGPSLSSSLSRRLRNSGSVKGGGQSPMFPNSAAAAIAVKKKGSGFEAVEPSSPKVTCIGQVRVKTKKKKKKKNAAAAALAANANNMNTNMLTRSASVSASRREASFRRSRSSAHGRGGGGGGAGACLPGSGGRNQKWVHQLPITICETLRAFGSDFSCFLPSSCAGGGGGGGGGGGRSRGCYSFSDGGDKDHRKERSTTATTYPSAAASSTSTSSSSSSSSCGAVFLRWLMAIQESEEDKGREVMRLMVEETEKEKFGFLLGDKTDFERKLQHEDKDEDDDVVVKVEKEKEMVVVEGGEEDVEKGRVSICIPPKNALLLMRCRSDPVRMAALANKFWGSPVLKIQCDKEEEEEEEDNEEEKVSSKLETDKDVHIYHVNEKKQAEEEIEKEKKTDLQAEQVLLKAGEVEKEVAVEVIDEEERLEGVVVLNEPNIEQGMLGQTEYEKTSEEMENHPQVMDEEERPVSKEEEGEMLQGKQEVSAEPLKKEDGKVVEEEEEETMEACVKELKDEEAHSVQRQKEENGEIKGGRRSTSNSISNKGKGGEHPKTTEVAKRRSCYSNSSKEKKERRRHSFSIEREPRRNSFSSEREARRSSFSVDREGRRRWSFSIDKEELVPKQHPMLTSSDVEKQQQQQKVDMPLTEEEAMEEIGRPPKVTLATQKMALTLEARDDEVAEKKKKKKNKKGEEVQLQDGEKKRRDLPECLLLMMYEPKLSMEVSKETWVCSTDFLRWRPNHNPQPQPNQQSSKANESNKEVTAVTPDSAAVDPPPPPRPPPAASPIVSGGCSGAVVLPQAAAPYAPFVLTRCKSEPLKSSARLAPESCFWKSRHQPIGATGIGF